jgi:hypothetical protein
VRPRLSATTSPAGAWDGCELTSGPSSGASDINKGAREMIHVGRLSRG